ncbi:MAG: hypothetical protein IT443_07260 [Phycisphaeraceae bacterium]|nr:hypothetical protein [Phycisphaeraceae bacterium]
MHGFYSSVGRNGCKAAAVAVMALGVLASCQAPPAGDTGGRVDPYRTTASDRMSEQASIPSLLEFCDRTSERLASDLSQIPEINEAKTRLVLELGDIVNKTRTSTTDFELIQHRLRSQLMQSKLIRDNFKIVESKARMDRELARVNANDDLLQENSTGKTATYDPNVSYVLQGDFYEARRNARREYYFEFKLTNLASRDIVFSHSYDLGQVAGQ